MSSPDITKQKCSGAQGTVLSCRNCTPLLYFDWLFRFWIYFDSPAHLISWYAAAGFFFGGALFIIGSFTSVAPAVRHWPSCRNLP